eukprot:1301118-Pleurochrysis_carterae.AAC.1
MSWRGVVFSQSESVVPPHAYNTIFFGHDAISRLRAVARDDIDSFRSTLQFLYDIEYVKKGRRNLHFWEALVKFSKTIDICTALQTWRDDFGGRLEELHEDEFFLLRS